MKQRKHFNRSAASAIVQLVRIRRQRVTGKCWAPVDVRLGVRGICTWFDGAAWLSDLTWLNGSAWLNRSAWLKRPSCLNRSAWLEGYPSLNRSAWLERSAWQSDLAWMNGSAGLSWVWLNRPAWYRSVWDNWTAWQRGVWYNRPTWLSGVRFNRSAWYDRAWYNRSDTARGFGGSASKFSIGYTSSRGLQILPPTMTTNTRSKCASRRDNWWPQSQNYMSLYVPDSEWWWERIDLAKQCQQQGGGKTE